MAVLKVWQGQGMGDDGRKILTGVGAQVDVTHIRHGMWAGTEAMLRLKMGV